MFRAPSLSLSHLNPLDQVLQGIQVTMDHLVIDQMPAPVEGLFSAHLGTDDW